MKTPRFSGPFKWSAVRQQLLSLREDIQSIQKVAGRNVTVSEHPGKGTVINAARVGAGAVSGACCFADGSCNVETADQCATDGGFYQGDGTTCEDPCVCEQIDLTYFASVTITASVSGDEGCSVDSTEHGWTVVHADPPGAPDDGYFWLYRRTNCVETLLTDGVNQCFGFNETIDDSHSVGANFCYASGVLTCFLEFNCPSGSGSQIADDTYTVGSLAAMPGSWSFSTVFTAGDHSYTLSATVGVA